MKNIAKKEKHMSQIVSIVKSEIDKLQKTPKDQAHLVTGDIRGISAKLFQSVEDKSIDSVLPLCEELLGEHDWPFGVIAYDFAYRVRKQYDEKTFAIFESWLIKYVRGWGDCDDFCTHAFGELICNHSELVGKVRKWVTREEFWMRRASAVILIPAIKKGKYQEVSPFTISDALMQDEHDLVLKGYGWMLKVLSQKEPDLVYDYLMKNRELKPRTAFRYALEKLDDGKKDILMGRI
jgi:3-methyladenine DNA glycosylase AlkD